MPDAFPQPQPKPSRWITTVEPEALIHHFLRHPPEDFEAFVSGSWLPGFRATFDLLTTASEEMRAAFAKIPGNRWLRRWLLRRVCFMGTTVSEFCPFPKGDAEALARDMFEVWDKQSALLIVKDIPSDAPFLPEPARRLANRMVTALEKRGCFMVDGQALAYVPVDFADEEAYLARLSAGRRRDIRRKLKRRKDLRIEIIHTGDRRLARPAFLSELYEQYLEVYAQSEIHFDLLTLEFFRAILNDASLDGRLFLYYREEDLIGHNLCFIHDEMLIDKYVGFRYPQARAYNLYFISWMENLAFARSEGLRYYIAGWTDPAIKSYLGASFTRTRHAVYVKNALLRLLLRPLSGHFEQDRGWRDETPSRPEP
ncbi:MAG: GNAT family N-acetyltransferase [Zoogloeaceae bacterium]|jgi:hypothetical protein|nr:GNAT family N-acetyltransferase [Zoogloeaceae bacterium]